MKLRAAIDGSDYLLDWNTSGGTADVRYQLSGEARTSSGEASVARGTPGVCSVLLGHRSFAVSVTEENGEYLAEVEGRRYRITLADARDRSAKLKTQGVSGPVELRAQMPGKVIKFLVAAGTAVQAGDSLVVIEAMKMQNELKAAKEGVVGKIFVAEGATVAAGEPLLRIE